MSRKLSKNILQSMNRKVRTSSLHALKKRGLKKVSLLDLSDLNVLIQEAVDNTLRELGISLAPRELRIQGDHVREEFLRIVRERNDLEESKAGLERELARLKDNFQRGAIRVEADRTLLRKAESRKIVKEDVPLTEEQVDRIGVDLRTSLRELFGGSGLDENLAGKAVKTVLSLIEKERKLAFAEAKARHDESILQLKRRINKLMSKLDETEQVLASIEIAGVPEEGIPSIYKSVQGLKEDAAFQDEKKAALSKMFELNLELKKLIDDT